MSDTEPVAEGTKEKDPSELVDEVFSLFKSYLNTQLEAQGKLIERLVKNRSASEFKFKDNRKQFEVNAKLENLLSRIKASADESSQVRSLVQEAQQIIRKR